MIIKDIGTSDTMRSQATHQTPQNITWPLNAAKYHANSSWNPFHCANFPSPRHTSRMRGETRVHATFATGPLTLPLSKPDTHRSTPITAWFTSRGAHCALIINFDRLNRMEMVSWNHSKWPGCLIWWIRSNGPGNGMKTSMLVFCLICMDGPSLVIFNVASHLETFRESV